MWLFAVPLALLASIALHAIVVRMAPSANRPVSFLAVGVLVGGAAVAWIAWRYGLSLQLAANVLCYAFACELYLFLFSSALTSISMNLLVRLLQHPMSDAEIAQVYDSRRMVQRRIERLEATGLMRPTASGRFEVTASGKRLLRLFDGMAVFFRNVPARPPTK